MKEGKLNLFNKKIGKIRLISALGLVVGAIGGYLYYSQIGCVSGTCAITSNPWMSTAWGAAFGYLVFDMFNGKKKNESTPTAPVDDKLTTMK